jgi:NAD(P)-dependent dehydrogenase (short-subunit alcohol dehydrogenase family)
MSKRFENKLVAITGAAGGMGQAFARRFAAEGALAVSLPIPELAPVTTATRRVSAVMFILHSLASWQNALLHPNFAATPRLSLIA